MKQTMLIVGLGLIGGSLALALKGFEDFEIVGVDVSQPTLRYAAEHGVGDRVTEDAAAELPQADVVALALHPQGIVDFLARYRDAFKPGALVWDVCGVKTAILEAAQVLPGTVDFIGCHPMAGTEFSGVEHAFAEMFRDSHFLLVPRDDSRPEHIALLERYDFTDICVSLKSSSVRTTMAAYRLMNRESDYPLHLGVTETGTLRMGTLKSAVGIGGLLAMGIGDTMRVSPSADPVEEVYAARDILKAAGVRKEGPELVSCPTCGRTRIDLIGLATQVEERLKAVDKPITVAVMGCVVNGPGEASAADVGIAGGNGEGLLFRKGEIVKKVPQEALVDELFALIEEL